jgi:hypothetical protein
MSERCVAGVGTGAASPAAAKWTRLACHWIGWVGGRVEAQSIAIAQASGDRMTAQVVQQPSFQALIRGIGTP